MRNIVAGICIVGLMLLLALFITVLEANAKSRRREDGATERVRIQACGAIPDQTIRAFCINGKVTNR